MDKRGRTRFNKRLFIKYGLEKPDKVGFTEDVSSSGLFVKANFVFPPGSILKIELTLPDERIVSMAAQVMWAKKVPPALVRHMKKSGMGLRLAQPDEAYKQFIEELHGGTIKDDS